MISVYFGRKKRHAPSSPYIQHIASSLNIAQHYPVSNDPTEHIAIVGGPAHCVKGHLHTVNRDDMGKRQLETVRILDYT